MKCINEVEITQKLTFLSPQLESNPWPCRYRLLIVQSVISTWERLFIYAFIFVVTFVQLSEMHLVVPQCFTVCISFSRNNLNNNKGKVHQMAFPGTEIKSAPRLFIMTMFCHASDWLAGVVFNYSWIFARIVTFGFICAFLFSCINWVTYWIAIYATLKLQYLFSARFILKGQLYKTNVKQTWHS